jgi:putative heme iron utilization protein
MKRLMPYAIAERLISDILSQNDIIISINSGSGICEVRLEENLPFRIRNQWATIGYEDKSWHIHLNLEQVVQAKFVEEARTDGKMSYSIRFIDNTGRLAMRANFVKMYDENGNIIQDKIATYKGLFEKYGKKEIVSLSD